MHNGLPLVCILNKYTELTEKERGELKCFVGVGPLSCISFVSLFRLISANWNDRLRGLIKAIAMQVFLLV